MMAGFASGVVENRIKACGERRRSRIRCGGKDKDSEGKPHHSNLPPNRIERTPLAPVITPTDPSLTPVAARGRSHPANVMNEN
jgi:hypothetical protein